MLVPERGWGFKSPLGHQNGWNSSNRIPRKVSDQLPSVGFLVQLRFPPGQQRGDSPSLGSRVLTRPQLTPQRLEFQPLVVIHSD